MASRLPATAPGDRIEIVRVPDVPGVEVLRIDARARLWRWYHDTYTVAAEFDAFRTSWRYGARVYDGTPGMLGLMEPGDAHAEVRKQQPHDVWRVLMFAPALVEAAAREIGMPGSRVHWRAAMVVRPNLRARVVAVHRALEGDATALERGTRVTALLHDLLRDHGADQPRTLRPADCAGRIRRARELLHDRWNEAVHLDELAAVSGMGRFQLVRAFHHAIGLPPHAYQLALRVARARSLIRAGMSLASVAAEAGFADQSHFTRRFAAAVGVSPAQFRHAVC